MRLQLRAAAIAGLALSLVLAAPSTGSLTADTTEPGVEVVRAKADLTAADDKSVKIPPALLTPEAARNIGPGSALLITIPGEGRFGCTANFIWADGAQRYLGAAGHCFLPGDKKSTHGEGADYDASGVEVSVCVDGCEGNFRTMLLVGKFVTLGSVPYARQTDPTGTEDIGNDFGVVEIPSAFAELVRPSLPVFGGPDGSGTLKAGAYGCHYGNGLVFGETFLTKARVGVGGGGDDEFWMGDFAGAPGDSGSALVKCKSDGATFRGQEAAGVLTHLGLGVCPCGVNFKKQTLQAQHGVIFGTTIARSIEMGREAGLSLSLVLAPKS